MIGWTSLEISFEETSLLNFGGSTIHTEDPTPRSMLITMIEVDTTEDQDRHKGKWHKPCNYEDFV